MLKVLKEMERQKASYFSVKRDAESKFMEFYDSGHKKTVWGNADCASWYVNSKGKIEALYPYNLVSFWRLTYGLDTDALEFQ